MAGARVRVAAWCAMRLDAEVQGLIAALDAIPRQRVGGLVTACGGGTVTASGLAGRAGVGEVCLIERRRPRCRRSPCSTSATRCWPRSWASARPACSCCPTRSRTASAAAHGSPWPRGRGMVRPSLALARAGCSTPWRRPIDGGPPLPRGSGAPIRCRRAASRPSAARGLGPRLSLGVRALDLFTPCCEGQRMGIFAGSGVGKSTLLSMIAAGTDAEVLVIGLIGERGRELHDFLEHTLGAEGRARSVVVVATSDQPPMLRRRAAYLTLTIAEFLRDQGLKVLCLMDSVTRFAMALARDLPRRRRGADQPRLSAGRVRRAAAPARARRARARATAASPACSRCWSRATTPTSR